LGLGQSAVGPRPALEGFLVSEMPRPKKHHYVTKAYLDGFLESGQEQLFCRMRRKDMGFRAKPDEIAFQKNYYSFKRKDGTWNDAAENFFANKIETPGLAVLKKLVAGNTRLKWDERNSLAMLLSIQEHRVPFNRSEFNRMHRELTSNIVSDYDERLSNREALTGYVTMQTTGGMTTREPAKVSIDTLRQVLQEPSDESEKKTLAMLVRTALELSDIYRHMKWTIYRADGKESFVTSDCPVIKLFTKSQTGYAALLREDIEVRFPLASKAMLVLRHDMPHLWDILRSKPSDARRKWWFIPEIRLETWNDSNVAKANRAHAAHSTALLIGGQDLGWAQHILEQPSRNIRMWIEREGQGFRTKTQIRFVPE
jgi:hypothetical protein